MRELYFEAPTPEQVSVTYKEMTFGEFTNLDDEAVKQLQTQERVEWFQACEQYSMADPEWNEAKEKIDTLARFAEWRRFGVPDRNMPSEEYVARLGHDIAVRRVQDPTYGELTEADTAHLTDDEWELTFLAMDEVSRSGLAQPVISVGGPIEHAIHRLGAGYKELVDKGVLEPYEIPSSIMWKASTGYVLAGKFATYTLVRLSFTGQKSDE